jgi:tRNA pseudouridine55 synthase
MDIDGIVLLDKPEGITSRKAVDIVLRALGTKRGGHFGSLDPFATGLLCIALGSATKLLPFMEDNDKEYIATVGLEKFTDTDDLTGQTLKTFEGQEADREKIDNWIEKNKGEILQLPPVYCAQKHNGQPLYKLKRKNIDVAPRAKTVCIHKMDIISCQGDTVKMRVVCSRGTYIRSLARDMGVHLGCGGYLRELRRLRSEGFSIKESNSIEDLKIKFEQGIQVVIPLSKATTLPVVKVNAAGKADIKNGRPILMSTMMEDICIADGAFASIYDEDDRLLCITKVKRTGGIFGYVERGFM